MHAYIHILYTHKIYSSHSINTQINLKPLNRHKSRASFNMISDAS